PGLAGCTPPSALTSVRPHFKPASIQLRAPTVLEGNTCSTPLLSGIAVKVRHNGKKAPGQAQATITAKAVVGTRPRAVRDFDSHNPAPGLGACPTPTATTTPSPAPAQPISTTSPILTTSTTSTIPTTSTTTSTLPTTSTTASTTTTTPTSTVPTTSTTTTTTT